MFTTFDITEIHNLKNFSSFLLYYFMQDINCTFNYMYTDISKDINFAFAKQSHTQM